MAECKKWQDQGVNLMYENRANRNGYKAGALREGLQKQYASDCEYVVIFDADFQPEPNFLMKTVPYLVGNNKLGMVQARWKFGKTYDISCSYLSPNLFYQIDETLMLCTILYINIII